MKQLLIKLFLISFLILYSCPVFSQEPLELLLFGEDEMVVTAVKREQRVIEAPATIRVITRKEIEAWGVRSLDEFLRLQHDIDITNNRVFTIASLRGCGGTSGSERILFLLDGKPLNAVILGSVEPKMIGLDNVEQIEILYGPGSAMYGANAFSGIINIITRSVNKDTLSVTTSIEVNKMIDRTKSPAKETSGDSRYCQVCYGNEIEDKMSLFLTASHLDADGARINADTKNDIITTKLKVPLPDSSNLIFQMGMFEGEMGLTEYFLENGQKLGRANPRNQYSDVLYHDVINPVSDLAIRVYSGIMELNLQLPTIRISSSTTTTTMEYPRYPESVNGLEIQHNWLINEQNFFIWGLDLRRAVGELPSYNTSSETGSYVVYENSTPKRYTGNTSALYIQDEFKPNNQLTLTMGARYDMHSVYGSMVSPRLGMVYNLKNHPTVFKASCGKAFRPPDFSELYNQQYFLSALVQKQEGKELVPEEITSYETAVFHQLTKKTMVRVAVFKNKMENLIDFSYHGFIGTTPTRREYANQSSAETKGIEMEMKKSLTDNLFASLFYTRLDTKLNITDNIPYIPKDKISLKLNYNPVDNLEMGLNGTSVGERRSMITRAHPTAVMLPSYFMLDSYLRWRLSDTVSLSVVGRNLLDEEYEEGPDFMTTRRQSVMIRIGWELL
ncbi:TonB-dependent receptor [Candidatus Desantisbacteria bacterium]|nr:TonB-dependent receptor [Candidatus Desantisbacteria bacterium]